LSEKFPRNFRGPPPSRCRKFFSNGAGPGAQAEPSLVSRCQEPSPARISTCVARGFQPLPFFIFGGPGLAGWILYRSASLVVDACCNKIPPSVRPLDFVAIYRLVHKWLLSLFVPNLTSVPSLFTPVFGITGRSVGRPQPRGVDRVPAYPPGSTALSCLSRKKLAS
jgi:hypothetical protein